MEQFNCVLSSWGRWAGFELFSRVIRTTHERELKIRLDHLIEDAFPHGGPNTTQRSMSLENYFRYLEWQELTEARANATQARTFSIAAIVISVISVFISIGISLWLASRPITIDPTQIDELKTAMSRPVTGQGP